MKKAFLVLSVLMMQMAVYSLDTLQVKSNITDVTVFFSGAQVTRHVDLEITRGKHLLIIDQLPGEIYPQSIMVQGAKNGKILSVKHQLVYPIEGRKGKEEKEILDELDRLEIKIRELKNNYSVFDLEEKLLLDNSRLGNEEKGVTVMELKEAADFYRVRFNEIRQKKLDITQDIDDVDKKIRELYARLNEITSTKRKIYSQIMISIDVEKPVSGGFDVSYYVPSAGWAPTYDFRVDDITKPLSIVYNANVYQSTGEGWTNVNMKLSANNPSLSGRKPELVTWYLGQRNPYRQDVVKQGQSALKGRVVDAETGEAMPFANVILEQNSQVITGGVTDMDGQYNIKPIPSGTYNVKISYIGYKAVLVNSVVMHADKVTFQDFSLKPENVHLEAVVISDYKTPLIEKDQSMSVKKLSSQEIRRMPGRSLNGEVEYLSGVASGYNDFWNRSQTDRQRNYSVHEDKEEGIVISNYISNSLKDNITNMEYVIDIPYTIPASGEDYLIRIKEVSLPVQYLYHAVPKVESGVFLSAEIADWTQLKLLAGDMNIYYQGTYTGRSFIDVEKASDTLSISLGRDHNILVMREGNKELFDKKQFGSNVRETIGWDITVRNNKAASVTMVIEDQFPVSEKKSIEVEPLEYEGARLEEKSGILTWTIHLEPGEKRVLSYKYSVKYPKSVNLLLD